MSGFNLPPGCSVNDLPGNTRADQIEEDIWDKIYEVFDNDVTDEIAHKVRKLVDDAYEYGYQSARQDAAEEAASKEGDINEDT